MPHLPVENINLPANHQDAGNVPGEVEKVSFGKVTPHSPTPRRVEQVDFSGAIAFILEGRNVTRVAWGKEGAHCGLHEGRLKIHKVDNKWYDWIISEEDVLAEDWIES